MKPNLQFSSNVTEGLTLSCCFLRDIQRLDPGSSLSWLSLASVMLYSMGGTYFILFKFWGTENFITIQTSWNTND
jgi:hypothetical protein